MKRLSNDFVILTSYNHIIARERTPRFTNDRPMIDEDGWFGDVKDLARAEAPNGINRTRFKMDF